MLTRVLTHSFATQTVVAELAAVDLDYAAGHISPPFTPVEDDQATRNDVTVDRPDGSSVRQVKTEGPLSADPPPVGVGRYDESVSLNLHSDRQLADQAAWRVHLGTVDEPRYPTVTVSLTRNRDLVRRIAAAETGDRAVIKHPPRWLPPQDVDQLLQGYSEQFTPHDWEWTANATPGSLWMVAVADDRTYGRLDTGGSHLLIDIPTGAPLGTGGSFETDADFAKWGFSNIGAGTFTRSTVRSWDGVASGLLEPDGVGSFPAILQTGDGAGPVSEAVDYQASARVWMPQPYTDVRIRIDWRDAAGAIIGNTSPVAYSILGGEWTLISTPGTAPVGAASAGVRVILGGTPTVDDMLWIDQAMLITGIAAELAVETPAGAPWIDSATYPTEFPFDIAVAGERMTVIDVQGAASPQVFHVARAANGVIKSQATGAAVTVAQPAVVAL